MTPVPPPDPAGSPTKAHLDAVDVVRVLTVALVIAVHVVSQQPGGIVAANGAVLIVMHVSRQVFFLLTTFVLAYSYRDRPPQRWSVFWRRRYLLVGVPYLVWSAVYFVADGHHLWPLGPALGGFAHDVAEGTARYHLYFLLVTMQVYLIFPLLLWLLHATRRWHAWLLAVAVGYQIVVYAAIEHPVKAGLLSWWLHNPSSLLPSYLGFVIIGGIAACHTDRFLGWTRARSRWIYAGCGLAIAAGVAVFLVGVLWYRQPPWAVSSVFQPVVVVESLAIAWTYLALGMAWQDRGTPARRLVRSGAEASFGVYLAHPLLLQALLLISATTGLSGVAERAPEGLVTAVSMVLVVPLIYLTCAVFAELVRRTPLSLPLTGRSRRRAPQPRPRSTTDQEKRPAPATQTVVSALAGTPDSARAESAAPENHRGTRRKKRRRRRTHQGAGQARSRRRRYAGVVIRPSRPSTARQGGGPGRPGTATSAAGSAPPGPSGWPAPPWARPPWPAPRRPARRGRSRPG
jgi:peptidoglycan/LPS O-acetylase OafA/YrhL